MYERMLNKALKPSEEEMKEYCGEAGALWGELNEFMVTELGTTKNVVFPYGNKYGWGIAHKRKSKFICNIFAEDQGFTVMVRLYNRDWDSLYDKVQPYMRDYIDHKFPCGEGGYIHYRVTKKEHLADIKLVVTAKANEKNK